VQACTISAVSDSGSQFIHAADFFKTAQLLCLVCSSLLHTAKIWSDFSFEIFEIYHRLVFQEHVNYLYNIAYLGAGFVQNVLRLFPGKNRLYIKLNFCNVNFRNYFVGQLQ
jgi:hypothetical protein